MNQRRIITHGFKHVSNGSQNFVLHVNELQRQLRRVRIIGSHCGNRVSFIKGLLSGQYVVAQELGVNHCPFAQVDDPASRLRKISRSYHGLHAWHRLGAGCVDVLDASMSVRAAQNLRVEQSRQAHVGAVLRPAGYLVRSVMADRPAPNNAVSLGGGRFLSGGHGAPSQAVSVPWLILEVEVRFFVVS